MSTKRINNDKKNKLSNILIIATIVLLIVLVAVIVIANGSEQRGINKILNGYVEVQYGEKADLSAQHYISDEANYWMADSYMYYPDENIICDYNRLLSLNTSVTDEINAYITELGEDYSLYSSQYFIYTDADDFTKDYAGLAIYYIGSATDIFETSDDAAQFVWDMISSCKDLTLTGINLNLFDSETEYYFDIDPFAGDEVTLELLEENVSVAEEKSTLYAIWQANLNLGNVEIVEGETESAE